MKFLFLSILILLPIQAFAESASMTLQALESMQRADDNARRICENIRRNPDCVTSLQEMRSVLGLSTIACHARFRSQNCTQEVNDNYPEFADQIATCSAHDVCQSAMISTFGRGCGRFGVQIKDQFLGTIQGMNACVQNWRCVGNQMLTGVMTILFPGLAAQRAANAAIQGVRDDINRAQVMGCFNSVTQAQFACHLLVKYGMAIATAGRATAMLGRMGTLDRLMRLPANVLLRARRIAAQQSQRLTQSGNFRFFNRSRTEAPIALRPGESYVAVVHNGKIVIGERYRNPNGTTPTQGTHLMLLEDITGRPYRAAYSGGAIRINRDGSFDVSGYRRGQADQRSADLMEAAIKEAIPGAVVRSTPDRLSTLAPR